MPAANSSADQRRINRADSLLSTRPAAPSQRARALLSGNNSTGSPSMIGRVLMKSRSKWLPTNKNPSRQSLFTFQPRLSPREPPPKLNLTDNESFQRLAPSQRTCKLQ